MLLSNMALPLRFMLADRDCGRRVVRVLLGVAPSPKHLHTYPVS